MRGVGKNEESFVSEARVPRTSSFCHILVIPVKKGGGHFRDSVGILGKGEPKNTVMPQPAGPKKVEGGLKEYANVEQRASPPWPI